MIYIYNLIYIYIEYTEFIFDTILYFQISFIIKIILTYTYAYIVHAYLRILPNKNTFI